MTDDAAPDVSQMVQRFEEAEQATQDARALAERDRDYYDGKQWTDTEKTALEKRGQPVVTFNRIQRKVNYLKGLEAQTRKDPKAFPRTPGDDQSAQAVTDSLRYVTDDQNWDNKRSTAFESIIVEGSGAIMVGAAQTKQGIDPALICIPWDRLFFDPFSRQVDFSDAAYMGIVTWMDVNEAKAKFPGREEVIDTTWAQARDSQTYDDRPKHNLWADYKRKRVRVVEMYYIERGQWMACHFTKAGYLNDPAPSPYLDVDGEPENPIKAMSAYVDRDNNRYGEVRAMISPQDEVNKRRSKGLHLINSRQVRISRGASAPGGMDATAIKRELAKPDGVIFGEDGEIEVIQTGDMAAANFQMLQEAKAEIDLLGPNAALAGKNENDQSGKAILAQQQGGMVEVALLMDRLRQLSLEVYRSVWARIKQYWDAPRWIRVTDDQRNLRFVGLNTPKTLADLLRGAMQGDKQSFDDIAEYLPQIAPIMQAASQGDQDAQLKIAVLLQSPMAGQQVKMENAVAEMDVDIILDEGMDTPTVQAEQFDTLSKMMPSMTQLPPEALELLIQSSSLRDKDKLLEIVEKMKQSQAASQEQQLQQQLMIADAKANIEKTQSETAKNMAQAQAQNPQAALQIEQVKTQGQMQMDQARTEHAMMLDEQKHQFNQALAADKHQAMMKMAAQKPQKAAA